MPDDIVFGGIAEQSGLLVYESRNPSYSTVIQTLLENIDFLVDHKKSFSAHSKTHGNTIQYVVDDELCFICSAREGFPQRICFAFLERIRSEWFASYHGKNNNEGFRQFLIDEMDFFSNNPEADKIRGLQSKVDQVTDIMHDNVGKLLARGERIEGIETKAEDLRQKTKTFDKKTKEVRCAMCMRNVKMTICLVVTIVVVLLLIGAIIFTITQVLGYPPLG